MLAEFRHFRRDHSLTIWLVLIARKIFLMIILGDVEILDRFHFCNDGAVPDSLGIQLADGLFGNGLLLWGVIENCRAVLCAHIRALAIQCGWVVNGEEDIQQVTE